MFIALKTPTKILLRAIQLQMQLKQHILAWKMCQKLAHQKYCRDASDTLHFQKAHHFRYVCNFVFVAIFHNLFVNYISLIHMSTNKMNRLPFVLPSV